MNHNLQQESCPLPTRYLKARVTITSNDVTLLIKGSILAEKVNTGTATQQMLSNYPCRGYCCTSERLLDSFQKKATHHSV